MSFLHLHTCPSPLEVQPRLAESPVLKTTLVKPWHLHGFLCDLGQVAQFATLRNGCCRSWK